eukprot:175996-Chlamydomonas_euryale.AAC.2
MQGTRSGKSGRKAGPAAGLRACGQSHAASIPPMPTHCRIATTPREANLSPWMPHGDRHPYGVAEHLPDADFSAGWAGITYRAAKNPLRVAPAL